MKKSFHLLTLLACLGMSAGTFALVGCENEGTMEEMGEEIDDEIDDATDE